jgi:ribosomal protein L11 methyltransferase
MIQISLLVDRTQLERVEQTLLDHGACSVTLCDAADNPVLEPLPGETPVWPRVVVTGLFGTDVRVPVLRRALHAVVDDVDLEVAALAERDWVRESLDTFKPLRFGRRLRILPSGDWEPDPTAVELRLDPGLAFGSGTHPTTALCLEWLDAHPPTGAEIIDYGCGSGILSLAAIKLGANRARAVDIDPQARLATRENAVRNGIPNNRLCVCAPAALSDERADLIVANILARPLVELARCFADRLKPGGRVVFCGVLAEQALEVIAAYAPWFELAPVRSREAWVLIEGAKPL